MYLPVFFELVWGETATQAGISLIPLMLAMPVSAMITGITMGKTGTYYVQPLVGAAVMIIGSALLTTFTYNTPVSQRVGFMILTGLGFGPGVVTPTQTAQAAVDAITATASADVTAEQPPASPPAS